MRISGPLTRGERGHPYGASIRDLSAIGYVEEEFLLEGVATMYSLADDTDYGFDGSWQTVPRQEVPYVTRILVNRPMDPGRFSGTVIVNWNNVSAGFDVAYGRSSLLYRSGWAWVGVTVQTIGAHGHPFLGTPGLRGWDPERYGALSLPDDDASLDVFSQAVASVGKGRGSEGGVDPMGGLPVTHVIATGASQSANRLATYFNAIQPLTQLLDGLHLIVYSGGGCRLHASGPGPSVPEIPEDLRHLVNLLPFGSHQLRTDLPTPVLVLNSENEAPWYWPARQPDDDAVRLWEVAGAAHAGHNARHDDVVAEILRDEEVDIFDPARSVAPVAQANRNILDFAAVREASLWHLEQWVRRRVLPPPQERIVFSGDPATIVRDQHGNAVGGIRLPEMAVPTATHVGASPPGLADLTGSTTSFSPDKLHELYSTREAYVAAYEAAVDEGERRGFILSEEGDEMKEAVESRSIEGLS